MGSLVIVVGGCDVLVDAEDYRWLKWFRWRISHGYAVCNSGPMHRIIVDATSDWLVDHKNRNRLDNRKENLRLATALQNVVNRAKSTSAKASQFKGVYIIPSSHRKKPWRARIRINGRHVSLGYFETELAAAAAYNQAALERHGEFAVLNKLD